MSYEYQVRTTAKGVVSAGKNSLPSGPIHAQNASILVLAVLKKDEVLGRRHDTPRGIGRETPNQYKRHKFQYVVLFQ